MHFQRKARATKLRVRIYMYRFAGRAIVASAVTLATFLGIGPGKIMQSLCTIGRSRYIAGYPRVTPQ